jgi:type VI secretion system protein ImpK
MDRVNWVAHDCFNAARQLRKASQGSSMSPAQLYARTRAIVDALIADAAKAGYASEDARLMAYAVVALLDEIVMAEQGPLREYWSANPLQLAYFKENLAGENFFVHLDRVRGDPTRVDVLRVFYLVLLFGFQGKYRMRGAEVALSDLVESVRTLLGRTLTVPEFLSPDAQAPEQSLFPAGPRVSLAWLGAGSLLVALVVYVSLRMVLAERADDVVAQLSAFAK